MEDDRKDFISLSLLRANRQIYIEASAIFWTNHTFYFPMPLAIERLLKGTTHYGTENMTSIALSLNGLEGYFIEALPRVLRLLTNRTKESALRSVNLVLNYKQLEQIGRITRNRSDGEMDLTLGHPVNLPYFHTLRDTLEHASLETPKHVVKAIVCVGLTEDQEREGRDISGRVSLKAEKIYQLSYAWRGRLHVSVSHRYDHVLKPDGTVKCSHILFETITLLLLFNQLSWW
jgi:hypothetical protein